MQMQTVTETVQTLSLSEPEIDPEIARRALQAVTYLRQSDIEKGFHEGGEMFYRKLDFVLGNDGAAKEEMNTQLNKLLVALRTRGTSDREQRMGDRHVEPCYVDGSMLTEFQMLPSSVPIPEGSDKSGYQSENFRYHVSTHDAYYTSQSMTQDMRKDLASLTVKENDEGQGPSDYNDNVKYKGNDSVHKSEGVTLPRVREQYEEVAKRHIDDVHTELPGRLPIQLRTSYTEKLGTLYVTTDMYEKISGDLVEAYDVYNEMPTTGVKVSLTVADGVYRHLSKPGHHYNDKLREAKMEITDDSFRKGIEAAEEGFISGGQLVMDGVEQMEKGVDFPNGVDGCRVLVLSFMTTMYATSTVRRNVSGNVPMKMVCVCVERKRAQEGKAITAAVTFAITIIPQLNLLRGSVTATGVSLNPFGDPSPIDSFTAFGITRTLSGKDGGVALTVEQEYHLSQLEHRARAGDGWTSVAEHRPTGGLPLTANGSEFQDAQHVKGRLRALLVEAMCLTIVSIYSILSGGVEIKPMSMLQYIEERRIPSIGVGGMVWHPYISFGDMLHYSTEDLLVRWSICFLFGFSMTTSTLKPTVYVHNQWRAAMAQLPPCIYKMGMVAWECSAPIVLLAQECGKGKQPHESTLTQKLGDMEASLNSRVSVADPSSFGFKMQTVLKLPPVPYTIDEVHQTRAYTVDSHGVLLSHDLTIVDAVLQMKLRWENDRKLPNGWSDDMVVWTPKYMIVVSYTAPDKYLRGESATAYLHSGPRGSRLAPSFHAKKAVSRVENSVRNVHYAALGRSGARGYIEGFKNSMDFINAYLRYS